MLKYNWGSIRKYTKNDMRKIIQYFTMMMWDDEVSLYSFMLDNKWAAQINSSSTEKNSYIINLKGFLQNRLRGTKEELFVYLDLLSRRNSFTYYNTNGKVKHIPTWKACDTYDIDKLKANRLLEIDENNIHFIYEEEIE